MKEAGTVIVFLVSSSISSLRVITLREEERRTYLHLCNMNTRALAAACELYLVSQDSVERGRLLQRRPDLDVVVDPRRGQNWNRERKKRVRKVGVGGGG